MIKRYGMKFFCAVAVLTLAGVLVAGCRTGRRHDNTKLKKDLKNKAAVEQKTGSGQHETGIRNVDFKNHTYEVEGISYPFKNGRWTGVEEPDAQVDVKQILYGNLMDNGREQAVVVLLGNWGGGNMAYGSVHVYDFHGGQAWEVATISGDTASIASNMLYVASPEWAEDDPFCCPSLTRTNAYRWNGLTFVQEQSLTEPAKPTDQ